MLHCRTVLPTAMLCCTAHASQAYSCKSEQQLDRDLVNLDSSPAPLFDLVVQLKLESVLHDYTNGRRRLLVLGYNATLTTAVEAPRQPKRHFDQIQVCCRPASAHPPPPLPPTFPPGLQAEQAAMSTLGVSSGIPAAPPPPLPPPKNSLLPPLLAG